MFKRSIKQQNIRRKDHGEVPDGNADGEAEVAFHQSLRSEQKSALDDDTEEAPISIIRSNAKSKSKILLNRGTSSTRLDTKGRLSQKDQTDNVQDLLGVKKKEPSNAQNGSLYSAAYLAELKAASSRAPKLEEDKGATNVHNDSREETFILTGDDIEPLEDGQYDSGHRAPDHFVPKPSESLDFISLDIGDDRSPVEKPGHDTYDHLVPPDRDLSSLGKPDGSRQTGVVSQTCLPTIGRQTIVEEDLDDRPSLDTSELSTEWERSQLKHSGGILGYRPKAEHTGKISAPVPLPRPTSSINAMQERIKAAVQAREQSIALYRSRDNAHDLELQSLEMIEHPADKLEAPKAKYEFFSAIQQWLKSAASLMARKQPTIAELEEKSLALAIQGCANDTPELGVLQSTFTSIGQDVDAEFDIQGGIETSCRFFAQWREQYSFLYEQSFAEASLCTLLDFWIRWEMCVWQPFLSGDSSSLESFFWYKAVSAYAQASPKPLQTGEARDNIVQQCVTRILLPRLANFAPAYKPIDDIARVSFVTLIESISTVLYTASDRETLASLCRTFGEDLLARSLLQNGSGN